MRSQRSWNPFVLGCVRADAISTENL